MILCGIDEAGRGPIAGDLVMCGLVLLSHVEGLDDSKKLTPKRREKLFEEIITKSRYHVAKFTPQEIDDNGIAHCLASGLRDIMLHVEADTYLFDGNTTFGVDGIETLVKADATILEVSAASIVAKVTHDRDILKEALIYPEYGLEKHKGYGTSLHVEMIKKYGYAKIHRKSYKVKSLVGFV